MKSPRTFALAMILALVGAAPAVLAQDKADKPAAKQDEKAPAELKIGDTAPKFEVEKFVKGKPVDNLDKGIYVVEFWATWCGPCIKNIPHLTEMQKEYKDKVRFVGVSIWEESHPLDDGKYLDRVTDFVKEMGDKMDYTVAFGGSPAPMATTWMKAAGQNGIPSAFIVKDNKVQWIGHPAGMEKVLKDVVAGSWDTKAAAETQAKERAKAKKVRELLSKAQKADEDDDKETLNATMDQLIEVAPEQYMGLFPRRLNSILSEKGEDAWYAYARKMVDGPLKDEPQALNAVAWTILDDEGIKKRDLDYAMNLSQKAVKLTDSKNAAILDTLARAYWEKKDVDNAVKYQEMAVKALTPDEEDTMKSELEENLKKYKDAKK